MKVERKQNWQTLLVWIIIMSGICFFQGFPDIGGFILYGWACLIVSGILVMIWGKIFPTETSRELSEEDRKQIDLMWAHSRGVELTRNGNYEEALADLDLAIAGGVGPDSRMWRAFCLQALDFHDEAIEDFDAAILREPKDCNLYFCRAISKRSSGNFDGAITDINMAIRLSQVGSKWNNDYMKHAKEMGWPEGHTSIYESQLLLTETIKNTDEHHRQRLMESNKKRRAGT